MFTFSIKNDSIKLVFKVINHYFLSFGIISSYNFIYIITLILVCHLKIKVIKNSHKNIYTILLY